MALSKTTQDHDEIRSWAEARGAKPAEVASTERNGDTGILRIEFPKAKNHNDSNLKEISWDEFFEKFDASGLALVYQDVTREGAESNFNKLIHPDDEDHPKSTRSSASASTRGAGKEADREAGKEAGKQAKTGAKKPPAKAPAKHSASHSAKAK